MRSKRALGTVIRNIAIVLIICALIIPQRTDMDFVEVGRVTFVYGEKEIHTMLSEDDLQEIIEMFDNKVLFRDSPACGFSESVSIQLNESEVLCLACDGHSLVYWKNKDRYFKVSSKDIVRLHELLSEYGFSFPCV